MTAIKRTLSIAFYIVMAFYAFLMLDFFFCFNIISSGVITERSFNLIPFKTIWEYLSRENRISVPRVVQNLLGNMIIFVPYGLYLQVLLKNKSVWKILLIVLLTSLAVEILQFAFMRGAADVDDLLLNLCGGLLGIGMYRLLRWMYQKEWPMKAVVTLISLFVGLPVMTLYFLPIFFRIF